MADICDDFKSKSKPEKGAMMPAEHGAILKDPSKSRLIGACFQKWLTQRVTDLQLQLA